MKKNCIAMLLAGGQGSRLYALTQNVAKPSVPFGGKYRIIDFPLSNCANSGIDTVGVLTQYRPLQLNSYIGNGQPWDLDVSDGGVYILPPYQSAGEKGSWFSADFEVWVREAERMRDEALAEDEMARDKAAHEQIVRRVTEELNRV